MNGECLVSKRGTTHIDYNLTEPFKSIEFNFSTKKKSIAFGISYAADSFKLYPQNIDSWDKAKQLLEESFKMSFIVKRTPKLVNISSSSHSNAKKSLSHSVSVATVNENTTSASFLVLLPAQKYRAGDFNIRGCFTTPVAGTYIFHFDNTFSKRTPKTVVYEIKTLTEAQVKEAKLSSILNGWLFKKRTKGVKTWVKRWFNLDGVILSYYKDIGRPIRGSVNVGLCTISQNPDKLLLTIDSGMIIYHLRAISKEDLQKWVFALSSLKKNIAAESRRGSIIEETQKLDKITLLKQKIEIGFKSPKSRESIEGIFCFGER